MKPSFSKIHFSYLTLDRTSSVPIHRQLYVFLRDRILRGYLRPGTRLPATRILAGDLQISRNTVLSAYKQLKAEGYLESNQGSDTRVTHTLPEQILSVDLIRKNRQNHPLGGAHSAHTAPSLDQKEDEAQSFSLSLRGERIMQFPYPYCDKSGSKPFSSAQPGLDQFPFQVWEKMIQAGWRKLKSEDLCYPSPLGYRPLREVLAQYLQSTRGVNCTADQVVITNGTQQALSDTIGLLLNPGDPVWVENPSYNGVKIALSKAEADITAVPIDQNGLILEEGFGIRNHSFSGYCILRNMECPS